MQVKVDRSNKTKPIVHFDSQDPGGEGRLFRYDTVVWAAKFADGTYRPKHRFLAAYNTDIGEVEATKKFLTDIPLLMRKGRYHDWFFGERRYEG